MRTFAVTDQRSLDQVDDGHRAAVPGDPAHRRRPRRARQLCPRKATGDRTLAEMLDKLASGISVEGMESLLPALVPATAWTLLTDLVPEGTHVLLGRPGADPDRARRGPGPHRAGVPRRVLDGRGHRRSGTDRPGRLGLPRAGRRAGRRPRPRAADLAHRAVRHRSEDADGAAAAELTTAVAAPAIAASSPRRSTTPASRQEAGGSTVLVVAGARHRGPGGRAAGRGRPRRGRRRTTACRTPRAPTSSRSPAAGSTTASSSRDSGLAVITESDLTGTRGANPADGRAPRCPAGGATPSIRWRSSPATTSCTPSTASASTSTWCSRTAGGADREYLVVEYAPSKRGHPGDRLFVPTDALDLLSRYVGGEVPTLNKLGGADWAKTKGRARKAVRQIAAKLVAALRGPGVGARATRSRRTPRGSANSRTRSPTPRRPTRWRRSTRSRPTWRSRSRWTG